MRDDMGNIPLIFEQVVAHLFQAKHNVTLQCTGTTRGVQFDGYREIHVDNLLTPIKIGIECKRWNRPVNRDEVSSFLTDVKHCKLHRGLMISFSGFQAGAIERAKSENIDLFEFRPCSQDDIEKKIKVINYAPIEPRHWHVGVEWEISQKEKDEFGSLLQNPEKFKFSDAYIVADNGTKTVKFGDFAVGLIEIEVFKKGKIEGTISIDCSHMDVYLQFKDVDFKPKIRTIQISYKFLGLQTHTTEFAPKNWYIMKDVIGNSLGLIPLSVIQEIEKRFRMKLE